MTRTHIIDALGRDNRDWRINRRRIETMADDAFAELADGYKRHLRACRSLECHPDPMWLTEAVGEIAGEREVVGV
jgi:hypothetical protein